MSKQLNKKTRKNSHIAKKPLHWLWGQQSVLETLQLARWRVYEIYATAEVAAQHAELMRQKGNEGIEVHVVPADKLIELSQSADHEGIVARVSVYPCLPIDELESVSKPSIASNPSYFPLLVAVDRIQDPIQFAALLRCCKEAAVSGVIIGEYCQTQITTQIARASLGAVNHFPVFQTSDLFAALEKAKSLGYSIAAAAPDASTSLDETHVGKPIALLVGSESLGIAKNLLEVCDEQISLRMLAKSVTLPTTVQTGIMLYEIRRKQSCTQTNS